MFFRLTLSKMENQPADGTRSVSPVLGQPAAEPPTSNQAAAVPANRFPATTNDGETWPSTSEGGPGAAETRPSASETQDLRTGFVPFSLMQNMMQEMMSSLIKTTADAFGTPNPKPIPRVRNLENIYVPAFDPDDRTDTVQIWCNNIDELKKEYDLTDREMLNLSRKN